MGPLHREGMLAKTASRVRVAREEDSCDEHDSWTAEP